MKNKGFTLIELLAVIVILAIIALIATPVILGIINESRENARDRSAELVVSTVKTAYATAYMGNQGMEPDIDDIMDKVGEDLSNATVTAITTGNTTTGFKVETKDSVICEFTLDGNVLKLTNGCGDHYKGTPTTVEIGNLTN